MQRKTLSRSEGPCHAMPTRRNDCMQQRCEAGSLSHPQPEKVAGGTQTAVQSTISRRHGGRLESGVDWTGGGQWDESKPPRSVRLCLASGMIQWHQGSEWDGAGSWHDWRWLRTVRRAARIGCSQSSQMRGAPSPAEFMLVGGLAITKTLHIHATLGTTHASPWFVMEAGLSLILPYLWSACRGAHRRGPSPASQSPFLPTHVSSSIFFAPVLAKSCCVASACCFICGKSTPARMRSGSA